MAAAETTWDFIVFHNRNDFEQFLLERKEKHDAQFILLIAECPSDFQSFPQWTLVSELKTDNQFLQLLRKVRIFIFNLY